MHSSNAGWDEVTWLKKKKEPKSTPGASSATSGGDTSRKQEFRRNDDPTKSNPKYASIANDTDVRGPPDTVPHNLAEAIRKARQSAGLSQKEVAVAINVKESTVSDYESGKGLKNNAILERLERVLKVKFRGKNIGSKL